MTKIELNDLEVLSDSELKFTSNSIVKMKLELVSAQGNLSNRKLLISNISTSLATLPKKFQLSKLIRRGGKEL